MIQLFLTVSQGKETKNHKLQEPVHLFKHKQKKGAFKDRKEKKKMILLNTTPGDLTLVNGITLALP